ncbi:MAG: UvrD-helicase domain-containing protein [Ignavibacteriales bacterium]|nr:UvrD-helicase domain-containing protein [Ignavibacteriales bacterium]
MSFLKELNPVQQEGVKAANGPVMIIAGAGSGKTRVLTYRIAYLIQCGVPPYQILALTFTNKAANEMKSRIVNLVGEEARQLWMGTFHSMFARILRREAEALEYTKSFTIYDDDDSFNVVKKSMERLGVSAQQYNARAIQSRISGSKNQLIYPQEYARLARDVFDEKTGIVYEEYQKNLRRSNAMDFDDLLMKPIELFHNEPDILKKYQERFKFILVDEFQDTNKAQYEVTKLLGSAHRNMCVVGDDAQSIYSFRGADIRNILDFAKDYPDCQTFRLEQNYRSTKNILGAADRLIRYNADRLQKNLWTDNTEGDPITVVECTDDQDEGYQIVQAIQAESHKNKFDLKDYVVVYRTNAQSRSLEDSLRRSSIPYVIVGGVRFYERKEIKDSLAYLRILVNTNDEESILRVINFPGRGIGETTVERLRTFAAEQGISLYDALALVERIQDIADRTKKSVRQFRSLVEKYRLLMPQMSLTELSRSLIDELGVLKMFKEEGTPESMNRWENVQELLSAISGFCDEREDPSLDSFLEEVALVSDIDTWEGSRNAVTLMTLHSSKGLEFRVVFIAGLEEGLLPFYSNTIERTDLEEERRLFYVGITRAQKKLYITHTKLRYRFGEVSYPSVSRFLTEIGTDNVERVTNELHRRTSAAASNGVRSNQRNGDRRAKRPLPAQSIDVLPDYESESQDTFEFQRGSMVVHETFGKGRVIEVTGNGESRKAAVQFEGYGVKRLILKFAKLRPA